MPDKKLIQRKIAEILKQLEHLKYINRLRDQELFGKESNFYFAERVMERLIGAAIDINMHCAPDFGEAMPEDYFSSFLTLAKLKILPFSFAKRIAPSTSLRNIIVHEYGNLDPKKFRKALRQAQKDYTKYVMYLERYL